MNVQALLSQYHDRFLARYGHQLTADQWSAFNALRGCREGPYGDLVLSCGACSARHALPRSCGHRACNQCQQHHAQDWLARQQRKRLPVTYFMATFTLPRELRALVRAHPKSVYAILMRSAVRTLKRFGLNKPGFEAELGFCAVLHTHTRRLDYHPHVHVVIPGGGIHRARREWRTLKGGYLFNGRALAKAFRGECLAQLEKAGLRPGPTPPQWIVQCQQVGRGKEALQYLSRYLYKGVLSNRNLLSDDGTQVTFRYRESQTNAWKTRTLPGEQLIALLLQHVLPKGFRRARDYGFLHGNAKAQLRIVHWVLQVDVPAPVAKTPFTLTCPQCTGAMRVVGVRAARASP